MKNKPLFTKGQIKIIQLLGDGYSAEEIAEKLKISRRTVEGQILRARARSNAKNMVHLYKIFMLQNMIA
jgi:DNA-binding CsgD family transcriptional regulator